MKIIVLVSALIFALQSGFAEAGDLSALQACVRNGYQSLSNRHALVAAVVDETDDQMMLFGAAKRNQIFEIGSITKTFTATLLAQAVTAGSVKLSDPIPSLYQKSNGIITYEHLTTHTSGIISGLFKDFPVTHPQSPFDGLTVPLFQSLYAQTPLANPPGSTWDYSNIGISLLGLLLSQGAGLPYEDLVITRIFKNLGMNDSYFQIPESELSRFPKGQMIDLNGVSADMDHWDLFKTAIDPAGGIRSTLADMVKYTRANLNPTHAPLAGAIQAAQQPLYFIKDAKMWMGMNWVIQPELGLVWHNGETYGFNSILAISKTRHQAVIAMTDTTVLAKDRKGIVTFDTSVQDVAFRCLK